MFWWLVQNTLLAGALALAAALAGRFARLSPAVRHALWLVVLIKLITPPVAFYSLPEGEAWSDWLSPPTEEASHAHLPSARAIVAATDPPALESGERVAEIADLPSHMERAVIDLGEPELGAMPIEFDQAVAQGFDEQPRHQSIANASIATAWQSLNFAAIRSAMVGIWAIGAGGMILLQAVRLWRFKRLLQNTESAPRELNSLVAEIAAQLTVSAPRVLLTSAACSPMVFAFGRPRLIWPNSLAEPLTGDARRAVIAHELAHLRRRDHWIGWLELVASCGWWWNPLFWYVRRQLHETAELACDAWVVSLLPGGRRAYAQALIDVSEMISWTAAPAPAVGMGASARHLFERRLTMILRERVPCRAPLVGLASIGLLGIAVLPGWTRGQAPAVESPQVSAPDTADEAVVSNPKAAKSPSDPTSGQAAKSGPKNASTVDLAMREASRPASTAPNAEAAPTTDTYRISRYDRGMTDYERLEARLAELAAELRALRQSDPRNRQVWNPFDRYPGAQNQEVRDIDLPELPSRRHVKFSLFVGQRVRLRLPDERTLRSVEIRTPEVLKIKQQSPRELVLIAVRQGDGLGNLWDEKQGAYSLHAVVREAAVDSPQPKGSAVPSNPDDTGARNRTEPSGDFAVRRILITYKLASAGQAAAFAAFIEEHIKDDVVSVKVFGDRLLVSATDDDQARIGQFVQLLRQTPEEPRVGQDNVQGATFYPSTQPIAIDAGFPVRVGETVPAIQPVLPASGTPTVDPAGPLPSLQESGTKGPLPPPAANAVPATVN